AAAGVAAGVTAGAGAAAGGSEGEIVAALQALGYSLVEAREASRAALADVGVSSTLEERVKAALRSRLRE
ncbi:MAG: Holliday junction branch migration protein RuvA, partial [Chloroflexota bacterium]|nr:Holliday junction branch migration protein RuvA [Chloroflexota bacterium]